MTPAPGVAVEIPSSRPTRSLRVEGAVAEGNFRGLYQAHSRLVRYTLGRLGVRGSDLMDLTQKVFLTAYLKLPEFEGHSGLSTWLRGICRHVALAYRRSSMIRYEVMTDPVMLELLSERSVGGAETAVAQQAALEQILSKLSTSQRIVFAMYEVGEFNATEIAELLDISLDTVRYRLRCARKVFRREAGRLAVASAFDRKRRPASCLRDLGKR